MTIARVALDVPLDSLFDYDTGGLVLRRGQLVVVPFGRRRQVGLVTTLATHTELPPEKLRRIERALPVDPLSEASLDLIGFCSEYYHQPFGQVALAALPTALRRVAYAGSKGDWGYALTESGKALDKESFPARAVVMRRLLQALRETALLSATDSRRISPRAVALLDTWTTQGWVVRKPWRTSAPSTPIAVATGGPELTQEQQLAVDRVSAGFGRFSPWLLDGVTGSGKTEVYLRLIERALARGGQVLLMIPEINLTPQLEGSFSSRFPGVRLVSLHSGLAEGERCTRWLAARDGTAQVILGTRLSVFAPLPRLELVIVDEEHDASFKQQDGVRYSARDLAVVLARQRQVPIVLGSATPALETYQNARVGRFGHLLLRSRPAARPPTVRIIPQRAAEATSGITPDMSEAIGARLARGEQSLVFLNRRGYAPALMCRACGWSAQCTRCSSRLVWHLRDAAVRCHYCGHEEPVPRTCPACGDQDLRGVGRGTQRLEQDLSQMFPRARILRVDRDSTRRKHAWRAMRDDVHGERADILVGTQMLAKGHDFPKITLVGIVNPDDALYSTDFRAAERLFQQLMQVAGRAGRATLPGEVLVQTAFPSHPIYQALQRQDYQAFAADLLHERERAGFPPFMYQAVLRAEALNEKSVMDFLADAASRGSSLASGVTLYDPVAAPVARVAGKFRAHVLAQSAARGDLQRFLAGWVRALAEEKLRRVRWSLDVDPLDL